MPEPFDLEKFHWQEVALVVAHPDDETFCSGLLKSLANKGATIRVYCLTRGEGGPTGDQGVTRAELGDVRATEMYHACAKLGVSELIFLGYHDPLGKNDQVLAPDVSAEYLSQQLTPYINAADLVISHGSNGEYQHPAHQLIFAAIESSHRKPELDWLTFLANHPDQPHPLPKMVNLEDPATHQLDATAYFQTRCEALACHQTQLALFAKFANGASYREFIEKTQLESYRKQ